jgi:hypothetical protein
MKLHGNARLSPKGRLLLCRRVLDDGWSLAAAAEAVGVGEARPASGPGLAGGQAGLLDRSSAPVVVANRTDERRIEVIAALRRLGTTDAELAECLGMALSTVSGVLTRIGMGKRGRLGLEPAVRYERARRGELVHIDVKKLGRIARPGHRIYGQRFRATKGHHRRRYDHGWEFVQSRSTTLPAWPTSKCSTTSRPWPRPAS